ncbi:MAG: cellulase family glycosylhydrolase [Cytophagaceae bacterium]|nr:cellulase family glycosylhydrolase [Cytophagaceae bacterium]MDW8455839.1 cellulase family glycosylhydrolase [Cytophagaceae bacterium]
MNIAWNNYGWDFGNNAAGYGGGNGYDPLWWENTFNDIKLHGGNCVRIWIHCKAEHNPLFNSSGFCTGLNTNFFNHLDDLLLRAENHNLMVIFCLFDFMLADVGRHDLIKDVHKTQAYINNALKPMVQRYAGKCNLLAWEIINEPEWIMSGVPGAGNHAGAPVTISEMQRFVGMCASVIHRNSSKYVTVGSTSIKWNSTVTPAVQNYWTDAMLRNATSDDPFAYLDFYQIHYYDWMGNSLSPFATLKSYWQLDKPVLIGETGDNGNYNFQQQYNLSYQNGYAGTLMWAYKSGGAAAWNDFKNAMKNFRNNNTSIVDFSCAAVSTTVPVEHSELPKTILIQKGQTLHLSASDFSNSYDFQLLDLYGK